MFEYFISSFVDFLTFSDILYIAAGSTAVLLATLTHKILWGGRT